MIIHVQSTLKTKLSCHDRSDQVLYVMKTRHDNDVTESIGVAYMENDTELSWSIRSGADYNKNQIGQLHDQLHRCGLCQKQNWVVVTNQT